MQNRMLPAHEPFTNCLFADYLVKGKAVRCLRDRFNAYYFHHRHQLRAGWTVILKKVRTVLSNKRATTLDALFIVLSILIVNIDNQSAASFSAIYEAAGLVAVAFSPTTQPLTYTAWPTLGSMIDSGKRLVTFLDNSADPATVPFLLDEFTQIWETPFDTTTNNWPCTVNRTRGDPTTQMYL